MRHFRLMSGRLGIAFIATYMLVLQAMLGAFALGAVNASPMLDAFGNPLCITSTDSTDSDTGRGEHNALPDCCTVACSMFAAATSEDRSPHSLSNPLPASAVRLRASFDPLVHVVALERSPGSPRSPPLTM